MSDEKPASASQIARRNNQWSAVNSPELAASWLSALVESADDAIITKTLEGKITSWNRGAERMFGYTAEEAIGQPVTMLIPEDHIDEEPTIIARLRAGERIEHYETVRIRKDGTALDISLTVSPIRDANNKIVGASKIARDISQRKHAERTLQEQSEANERLYREAQESGRLKEEFLATISHELRTPLNAILGWARIMRTGKLKEEETKKALETIERNARAQAQLIDDLLDVSRIITGKLRMDVRPIDPNGFIEAAIDAVNPAAEAKGIRVQKIMDTGIVTVPGDPIRLQQVIWNLLSNAIKFTPRGGNVQVRMERVDSHLQIVVADSGQGIPQEFLPHVFDRFRQIDQSSTRQHGGLGLGLALVRHLVELHGGSVAATSPGPGQGSTFTIVLPVVPIYHVNANGVQVHPTARTLLPSADYCASLEGLMILIVDDEHDTRELLRTSLSECGAEVTVAGSVAEAFAAFEASIPDILISDIGMPDVDGYELIRRLRELPLEGGGKVPAIALTAYARVEDRLKALRAGFQMHVPKPVELAELVTVVASVAGRSVK
jgi:PAS domain S-box-containing protein